MKTVVVNSERMNYDGKLDFSILSDIVEEYRDSTEEEILTRAKGADILVTKELPVRRELIEKLPSTVKLICEAGTGYNNIDLAAAKEKGIAVCNVPAYSTQRVAQTAIMMILNLSSCMRVQMDMLSRGDHRNFTEHLLVDHTEVNDKTLGIIGAGTIGKEVMKIALALGMKVLAYKRHPEENSDGVTYTDLDTLLRESDYVSLHCPLNDSTRHLMNAENFAKMKPTACLINTGRGAVVDEKALIEALQNGVIAGAGIDVQETEPPAEDNPLYSMTNVILTPHMGWKGLETRQRLVHILAENIRCYAEGNPQNMVG